MLHKAYVKKQGSNEEFIPVTMRGLQFFSNNLPELQQMVSVMQQNFPINEYVIRETNELQA